jgi:hypothetical protein
VRDVDEDEESKDLHKVLAEFKAEIKNVLSADDFAAHFEMAIAYEQMGLHAEELDVVARAKGFDESKLTEFRRIQAMTFLVHARTREAAGDFAGALLDCQRIRASHPDNQEASAGHARLASVVLLP